MKRGNLQRYEGLLNDNKRYTIQPVIDNGHDSLAGIFDIGIKKVTLTKIHINFHDKFNSSIIIPGSNVFDTLHAQNIHLAKQKGISGRRAVFKVTMTDGTKHTLIIEPPDTIFYDGNPGIIHHWLTKRGFVIDKSLAAKKIPRPLNPSATFLTSAMTVPL